jgi:hypothetical protein
MTSGDKVIYKGDVRTIYITYSDTMVSLCLIDKNGYEYEDVEEDYQTPINELTKIEEVILTINQLRGIFLSGGEFEKQHIELDMGERDEIDAPDFGELLSSLQLKYK